MQVLGYDDGYRCAFIRLIEIMVDAERGDDSRFSAHGGGHRGFATLMECLVRTNGIDRLRALTSPAPDCGRCVPALSSLSRGSAVETEWMVSAAWCRLPHWAVGGYPTLG
ncbi:hypothetical protein [Nocardia arthritidis]|uniref:hypothetical protein n=1 Tax=Nocardia arthritidis TaxID=228602 RepID=UPI0012ECF671|nr:hypothetical protein [Nocardia arthritidis]